MFRTESPLEMFGAESSLDMVGTESPLDMFKTESPLEMFGAESPLDMFDTKSPLEMFGTENLLDMVGIESLLDIFGAESLLEMVEAESSLDMVKTESPLDMFGTESLLEMFGAESLLEIVGLKSWCPERAERCLGFSKPPAHEILSCYLFVACAALNHHVGQSRVLYKIFALTLELRRHTSSVQSMEGFLDAAEAASLRPQVIGHPSGSLVSCHTLGVAIRGIGCELSHAWSSQNVVPEMRFCYKYPFGPASSVQFMEGFLGAAEAASLRPQVIGHPSGSLGVEIVSSSSEGTTTTDSKVLKALMIM
ncbi:hypothetical protein BHE74_00053570 [Ensete ventricosum]|nr:hypothetical protein BHE74_00053570 [Ensete ventricosum]